MVALTRYGLILDENRNGGRVQGKGDQWLFYLNQKTVDADFKPAPTAPTRYQRL